MGPVRWELSSISAITSTETFENSRLATALNAAAAPLVTLRRRRRVRSTSAAQHTSDSAEYARNEDRLSSDDLEVLPPVIHEDPPVPVLEVHPCVGTVDPDGVDDRRGAARALLVAREPRALRVVPHAWPERLVPEQSRAPLFHTRGRVRLEGLEVRFLQNNYTLAHSTYNFSAGDRETTQTKVDF